MEMKRDMDLVRQILREIEDAPYTGDAVGFSIPNCTDEQLQYHLQLLHEAGLIDGMDASTLDGLAFLPTRLTWQGHEFLEASRDDGMWEKAKTLALKTVGGLSFDVLVFALKEWAKQKLLGGPTSSI
jgi:Hypothetical protein (DUF2513)